MFWYLVLERLKDWKLIPWRAYDVPSVWRFPLLGLISHTFISVVNVEDLTSFTPNSLDFITSYSAILCHALESPQK